MKNKNKPKRKLKKLKRSQPKNFKCAADSPAHKHNHKPFNAWVYKYFDMTGNGIDNSTNKHNNNDR